MLTLKIMWLKFKVSKTRYYIFELPRKWLICSWLHYKDRCYPEVWKEESNFWHCDKCHPCNEVFYDMSAFLKIEELRKKYDSKRVNKSTI